MKDSLLIIFHSRHGYVKRYVEILGNAVGCDAVPAKKFRGEMLQFYDKVLFMGSLRNDIIGGLKYISPFYDVMYKKLIVCGVGVSPFHEYMPKHIKDSSVSAIYEKFVPCFYVQGGFDIKELSVMEKLAVNMRIKGIKSMNSMNDDDAYFVKAVETPVDEVKKENIQLLIDYLEGREVDEKLYSPPEITDPEEIKKYFEELEAATNNGKTPKDKKNKSDKAESADKTESADKSDSAENVDNK